MTNTVQLRLVLDVRFDLNGTSVEDLKKNLRFVAEHAYAEGLMTNDTAAEVDEHSFSVMETPEPLEPGAIADFVLEQIESGVLKLEDIPDRIAEYGLMETPDFVAEIRKRMESQEAESVGADTADDATALTARTFNGFVQAHQDIIAPLYADYLRTVVGDATNSDFDEFLMDQVSDLKGMLGSEAANDCSDDEDEQETAISLAEAWVTDNVSPSTEMCIAAVLYVLGTEKGAEEIRRHLG